MTLFFVYLLFETLVSVEISSIIGGFNTFIEIILSSILGIFIIKNFKSIMKFNIFELSSGKIGFNEFKNRNLFPIIGAIMLLIPGFLTDFIGILFQFSILTTFIFSRFDFSKNNNNNNVNNNVNNNENYIDIEDLRKEQELKR
jgi:UPF0716 family protein affecting phage T7 exclusion